MSDEAREERVPNTPDEITAMIDEMSSGLSKQPKKIVEDVPDNLTPEQEDELAAKLEAGHEQDEEEGEAEGDVGEDGGGAEEGGEEEEEAVEEAAEGEGEGEVTPPPPGWEQERAALVALVNQMAAGQHGGQVAQKAAPIESVNLTEELYEEAMASREGLEKVLTNVANYSRQMAMSELPRIIARQFEARDAVTRLFSDDNNRDLADLQPVLLREAAAIEAVNPDASPYDILQKAAENVRKAIPRGLQKQATGEKKQPTKEGVTPRKGAFASGTGKRKPAPLSPKKGGPKSVTDQIEEMFNSR